MTITYDEAIARLVANPSSYDTLSELFALVQQVSTDVMPGQTQGSVTVGYSGPLSACVHSTDVVQHMVDSGQDVRLIDKTQVGSLLASREFLTAVGNTQGLTLEQMRDKRFEHTVKSD